MIHLITTQDYDWNAEHMGLLADHIEVKLQRLGICAKKEHILRFLQEL